MNRKLKTKYLGQKIIYYNQLDSTQKEIWRRIENDNIENGNIIVAQIQTDGIGTHGRRWYTSEQNNIAFSIYLKIEKPVEYIKTITLELAKTFVEVFKNLYEIEIQIKTPNDLIINNKKIGGILTQSKLQGEIVKYLVIGIGINTNQENFNQEIINIATSVKKETKIEINNENIIIEFCNLFERKLEKMLKG